ncbi:MAG: hypothetical protein ACRCXB_28005 [Aeromonadaceae bacterium]
MENVKYYMNNPCEVIRVISDDFVEIKVYPKFVDDDFNGSGWCTECTAGSGYSRHTCREYQDVIDYIVDYGQSMIVVAESRLVQDAPIEFKQWNSLRNSIKSKSLELSEINESISSGKREVSWMSQYCVDLKEEMQDLKDSISISSEKINELSGKESDLERRLGKVCASISLGVIVASMSIDELKGLVEAKVILDSLKRGGVDNWEWYSESMPEDVEGDVVSYISSIEVKIS